VRLKQLIVQLTQLKKLITGQLKSGCNQLDKLQQKSERGGDLAKITLSSLPLLSTTNELKAMKLECSLNVSKNCQSQSYP